MEEDGMVNAMTEQERFRLLATYGQCEVCGAPRRSHRIVETHLDGSTTEITRLVCTEEPVKHYMR